MAISALMIVAISIGVIVLWTLTVRRYGSGVRRDRLLQWGDTVVATIVSVGLGLGAGFIVYDAQVAQADKRQRRELRSLLAAELLDIRRQLSSDERLVITSPPQQVQHKILFAAVQPLIIERAASSGLFPVSETSQFLELAREVRLHNLNIQLLISLIAANAFDEQIDIVASNLDRSRARISAAINDIERKQRL